MPYILGLDQGSTKTHAAVTTLQGEILSVGMAGGACHTISGMEKAMAMIREATDQALFAAGLNLSDIAVVSGGISGIDYPGEKAQVTKALQQTLGIRNVQVDNDCIGALWGGTFARPALVCCAGTGLNVGGVGENGRILQLNNYCAGEYQGGNAIGFAAMRAVYDQRIGVGAPTLLTEIFLAHTGMADVDSLQHRCHRVRDIRYSKLCPLVFEAAAMGDAVAAEILWKMGIGWGEYVAAAARELGIAHETNIPVVCSGSVFKGSPHIPREAMQTVFAKKLPGASLVEARYEPVVGGVVMGLYAIGAKDWEHNLAQSAKKLGLLRNPN